MLAVLAFIAAASMGADSDARDVAMSVLPNGASVTLDAMPYTRTVTASSYTLTGTSTGSGAVSWAASPSGSSGACTGTDSWSCVVTVTPDAVGEGVEVITVTRGTATDTETLGFYVGGAHSTFLSQNVNGAYNVGLADLDAVSTWENVGTSALDVTQAGAASLKPTFRTGIVGGQPVVRCDGGDNLAAAAAADWIFLHDGMDYSVDAVAATASANPNAMQTIAATCDGNAGTTTGTIIAYDDRSLYSRNDILYDTVSNGVSYIAVGVSANGAAASAVFHEVAVVLDEGGGTELVGYVDGTSRLTVASVTGYSAGSPQVPLSICNVNGSYSMTGDLFRILIYQSALDATQRGINKAVDEWALGGTLPVTP